jgi:hypothetical protein
VTVLELARSFAEEGLPSPLAMLDAIGLSPEDVSRVSAEVMARIHTLPIAEGADVLYTYLSLGIAVGIAWKRAQRGEGGQSQQQHRQAQSN